MALKIYKKGAYVVINNSGKLTELNSAEVSITKDTEEIDIYEVKHNGVPVLKAQLSDILDENGVAYVEADWGIFRYEQTGSVNSSEVANPYPAPSIITVEITPTLTTYSDGRAAVESGILAIGSTPIDLLPAPGAGMYHEWACRVEFEGGTTGYTLVDDIVIGSTSSYGGSYIGSNFITDNVDKAFFASCYSKGQEGGNNAGIQVGYYMPLNEAISLFTYNAVDPTLGDGTFRIIISYTVKTFGA